MHLRKVARELGLLVEPSFNYNFHSKKEVTFSVPIGNLYQIHFSVSPTGNFRLVPKSAGDKIWLHLNGQKNVTINLF